MARIAIARGYARNRIFEKGDTVPDSVGPAKWIREDDIDPGPEAALGRDDGLETRTKKGLVDIAKAENVAIETDDNKADLIRKIRAARAAPAVKD